MAVDRDRDSRGAAKTYPKAQDTSLTKTEESLFRDSRAAEKTYPKQQVKSMAQIEQEAQQAIAKATDTSAIDKAMAETKAVEAEVAAAEKQAQETAIAAATANVALGALNAQQGKPVSPEDPYAGLTPFERFSAVQRQQQKQDAFQGIVDAFKTYGIEGLSDTVFALMSDPAVGENQAVFKLKYDTTINPATNKPWNDAYAKRFAANTQRIKEGKPALSEAQYLAAERSYAQVMRSQGVTKLATRENFSKLIAGDVSADEVVDRINTAVERVQNASSQTKTALASFYPGLGTLDIVEAMLDPEVSLPALKRKIATAEIGGAALTAGLQTSAQRAEELQKMGVTAAQAREGFQTVAQLTPRGGQLAEIYKEQPYTQQVAESEVFGTTGSTEARRRRERLTQKEQASFAGRSGAFQGALARDRAGAI